MAPSLSDKLEEQTLVIRLIGRYSLISRAYLVFDVFNKGRQYESSVEMLGKLKTTQKLFRLIAESTYKGIPKVC